VSAAEVPYFDAEDPPDISDDWDDVDDAPVIEQMERLVRRYARLIADRQRIEEQRLRWVTRYNEWAQTQTVPVDRLMAETRARIEMLMELANVRTQHLPSGTVRSVPPRATVEVDDPETFERWVEAQESPGDYARWTLHPKKVELRKAIEEGEIVPGVHVEPGERKVSITLEGDDQ